MDKAEEIAKLVLDTALNRAKELGDENPMATTFKAVCMAQDALKRYAVMLAVLGPEKMAEFGEYLMEKEAADAVSQAEDLLKGAD